LDTNEKKKSIAKKTSTPFIVFQNFENESSTTIDALGFQKKRWQIQILKFLGRTTSSFHVFLAFHFENYLTSNLTSEVW